MGRLLLIRHGQSTWNAQSRWQGHADPPLSPLGEAQAHAAAAALADAGLDLVVTSDLRRARRTAEIVAAALDLGDVELEPALRERDVGEWTGRTTDEIAARSPDLLAHWRAGELAGPPGGETDEELLRRAVPALERHAARAGTILVVTHGGLIHAIERHLGGGASGVGNVCGRWLEPGPCLGQAVVVPVIDGPAARSRV